MNDIDQLANSIKERASEARQTQIRFVKCLSVDWDNKTMDARGTSDGVDYLDVTLGYGFMDVKPKTGTICLIGIIEGQEVVTFLINAEEVELVEIKADKIVFNNGPNDGIPNSPEVTKKLNALEKDLNTLKSIFSAWVPPPAPAIDNGVALKTAVTSWAIRQISVTEQSDIEDPNIKH